MSALHACKSWREEDVWSLPIMFFFGILFTFQKQMGVQPVVQVQASIPPQIITQDAPEVIHLPKVEVPPSPKPLLRETIPDSFQIEIFPSPPSGEENFLTQIYTHNKQSSSAAVLKSKEQLHLHRGSIPERNKKNKLSKASEAAVNMVSEGTVDKENSNIRVLKQDNRKSRSANSGYQCTIEDCEDQSMPSPQ